MTPDGKVHRVAEQGLEGPVNDLLWHTGRLYVAHRGKISVLDQGDVLHLVTDLPSMGDHHTNQMSAGPDGKIYFGQGTATNSGVVGIDNYRMGWLKKMPSVHDVPGHPIKLADRTFETPNPLSQEESDKAITSAFHPFDEAAPTETTIPGRKKANGAVLSVKPDGSELDVYAWGFRNPFGVQWSPQGMLYATENGMDDRGSRPITNDWEDLYLVSKGGWYGWPDYCSGMPVTDERFRPKGKPAIQFLMQDHPPVHKPYMKFPPHSAIAKIAFSQGGPFGPNGTMYVAFFGHMAPMTGTVKEHGGHRVVRIDLNAKKAETFFGQKHHHQHNSDTRAPSGKRANHRDGEQAAKEHESSSHRVATPGPRRLVDIAFSPDGDAMYVVDFGAMFVEPEKVTPVRKTGVIWRILPAAAPAD